MTLLEAVSKRSELESLLAFVNRKAVVAIMLFGGLRPGEVFGLQWENINFSRNVIEVRHTFTRYDGLKDPKTEAGMRT